MERAIEDFDIAQLQGAWRQPGPTGGVRIALIYLNGMELLRGSAFDFSSRELADRWFDETFPGLDLDELHSRWVDYPVAPPGSH